MQSRFFFVLAVCVWIVPTTPAQAPYQPQSPSQPISVPGQYPVVPPGSQYPPGQYPAQAPGSQYPPVAQNQGMPGSPTPAPSPAPAPSMMPNDLPPTPIEKGGDFKHGSIYVPPQPGYEPERNWSYCDPDFRNRWWIGVGILMGFSDRGTFPSSWTVPATGAAVAFGTSRESKFNTGLLIDGGFWFDRDQTHGIDASYLDFYNRYHMWDTIPTAPIGAGIGTDAEAVQTTEYWSTDVNYRHKLWDRDGLRVDGLIGFRFAEVWERAEVLSILTDSSGNEVDFLDRATVKNYFYGGQLGLSSNYRMGLWDFSATGKIAFGGMHSKATFNGDSAVAIASGTPIGTIPSLDKTQFAVMPSVSLNVSRVIWHTTRVYLGYDFQYLNRTVRAADVYGPFAGAGLSADKGFWVQGIRLGLETRY